MMVVRWLVVSLFYVGLCGGLILVGFRCRFPCEWVVCRVEAVFGLFVSCFVGVAFLFEYGAFSVPCAVSMCVTVYAEE